VSIAGRLGSEQCSDPHLADRKVRWTRTECPAPVPPLRALKSHQQFGEATFDQPIEMANFVILRRTCSKLFLRWPHPRAIQNPRSEPSIGESEFADSVIFLRRSSDLDISGLRLCSSLPCAVAPSQSPGFALFNYLPDRHLRRLHTAVNRAPK
jgi:hypothetical protein